MSQTASIAFGDTAASLILDCRHGRPSAATCKVYRADQDDTAAAEFTPTCTVETTPNTTTSAAAGRDEDDARKITLTALTGVTVGRRYPIVGADGLTELVEVASKVSTPTIYVLTRHPLKNQYATGATFHSTRVTAPVDTTWVADVSNLSPGGTPNPGYRVRWSVTVGGLVRIYTTGLDLVRYPADHDVTPLDVDDAHAGFLDNLGPDDVADQGRRLIDRAWRSVVMEMYADKLADQAIRNPELVSRLAIQRIPLQMLEDAAQAGGTVTAEGLAFARDNYRSIYDQTLRSSVAPVDFGGGGAAAPGKPRYLGER
jgi:hypothetical protein